MVEVDIDLGTKFKHAGCGLRLNLLGLGTRLYHAGCEPRLRVEAERLGLRLRLRVRAEGWD